MALEGSTEGPRRCRPSPSGVSLRERIGPALRQIRSAVERTNGERPHGHPGRPRCRGGCAPQGAPRDHRGERILDRWADLGRAPGNSGRLRLLPRRRGRLYAQGAHRPARYHRRGHARLPLEREAHAALAPPTEQARHRATWGLAETGATGPSGNRYGDPAGHSCIAVAGPAPRAITLRTGSDDRTANMRAFARRALEELAAALGP